MTNVVIATIVEGDGDVLAVPKLLARLHPEWIYPRPIRVPRQRLGLDDVLEKYVCIARANVIERGAMGAVLILVDAENDCPADVAPIWLQRAERQLPPSLLSEVVLAKRMFETWLVAGESCPSVQVPSNPEEGPNPKNLLQHALGKYSETADQPRLTSNINVELARQRCPSFDKLMRALARFVAHFAAQ